MRSCGDLACLPPLRDTIPPNMFFGVANAEGSSARQRMQRSSESRAKKQFCTGRVRCGGGAAKASPGYAIHSLINVVRDSLISKREPLMNFVLLSRLSVGLLFYQAQATISEFSIPFDKQEHILGPGTECVIKHWVESCPASARQPSNYVPCLPQPHRSRLETVNVGKNSPFTPYFPHYPELICCGQT